MTQLDTRVRKNGALFTNFYLVYVVPLSFVNIGSLLCPPASQLRM
jgi:hypothetical protein